MANFGNLIGDFMQSAISANGQERMGNVLSDLRQSFGAAGAEQGGASGSALGGSSGGALGGMLDMARGALSGAGQNPMQAGGMGAMLGSLLGGGGQSVSGALKGGAMAVLASLAFKALSGGGQNLAGGAGAGGLSRLTEGSSTAQMPVGMRPPETPAEEQEVETTAQLVIKGMINIAKSDGQISGAEMDRIVGKLQEAGMDDDAKAWVMQQFQQPLNLDAFAAEIPNPEVAAQVYAASMLAVDLDTDEEKQYLQQFAAKTGLSPAVVQYLHSSMGVSL